VVIVYIHCFDCYYTLKGSRILSGCSVNEISCYCPGGCDQDILYISAYTGCHILLYGCLWSSTTHITKDARPNIVEALLTLIFRMWLGVWVCFFWTSRWVICRKWTVTYQCQYCTINSSISECDQQCETRNAEPGIGTDWSSQTHWNPWVDGYGSGFGLPTVSRSGFWTGLGPNWPGSRSKPGPLLGYQDPYLTLNVTVVRYASLRDHVHQWIRNGDVTKLLDKTEYSHKLYIGCQ